MARSRLLKPGFFKNEDLAQLEPHARLCFAGLWLLADREGRLEDRPLRIKAEIFPYEQVDLNALLDCLHRASFIQRYRAQNQPYIAIAKFSQHQTPHIREVHSTIPAPDKTDASMVLEQVEASPRTPCTVLVSVPVSISVPVSDPDPVSKSSRSQKGATEALLKPVNGRGHGHTRAPDTRSKRPIFSGQRLTVFEWFLDKAEQILGPKHFMAFDIHEWFFTLDAHAAKADVVIPQRDNGAWLEQQLIAEATRRELPVAVNAPQLSKRGMRDAAAMQLMRSIS